MYHSFLGTKNAYNQVLKNTIFRIHPIHQETASLEYVMHCINLNSTDKAASTSPCVCAKQTCCSAACTPLRPSWYYTGPGCLTCSFMGQASNPVGNPSHF